MTPCFICTRPLAPDDQRIEQATAAGIAFGRRHTRTVTITICRSRSGCESRKAREDLAAVVELRKN